MEIMPKKNLKFIFDLIYIAFVFSLSYVFGLGIGLELKILYQILLTSIITLSVKFFLFNPRVLSVIIFLGIIITALVDRFLTPVFFVLFEKTHYLFNNILSNLQGKENIAWDNLIFFWAILIILLSLFTAFILFKDKNIYILLPIYMGFFLYYWYNFYDEAYWMISIFLFAFLVLLSLKKYSINASTIKSSTNYDFERIYMPWLKTITIYSILIVFMAILLPKSNTYVQWPWLQEKVHRAFPFIENLRSYDDYNRRTGSATLFNFSITGFQRDGSRLGGPVDLIDKKIMKVHSDNIVYLRGNVRHTYSGDSWETIENTSRSYKLRWDFSGLSKEEQRAYYNQKYITITNHNFASTSIFSPYKTSAMFFDNESTLRKNPDDVLVFPEGIYDGESYALSVLEPKPYGILMSLDINQNKSQLDDLSIYLQTPKGKITKRTKILLNEIIKTVKNKNSDFEKAVAIESFLRRNYNYSLDVGFLPYNKEFIDHFLFEEKEGYCTYFATSMAIMLRLEGIPSRYVEGYLAHDLIEPGIYKVSHKNAHTWVEAFIEPVGWMRFEPTPAYSIESRLENYKASPSDGEINPNESNENSGDSIRDINDLIIEDDQNLISGQKNQIPLVIENAISKSSIDIFIFALLLMIPIKFLIGFTIYKYKEFQIRKLSNNIRVIYLYKDIILLLKFLGYPQEYGETHFEYANRVSYKFNFSDEQGIREITEIFVRSKYSNYLSSNKDILKLKEYKTILEGRLRNRFGRYKYYYLMYIKRVH